MKKLLALLLLSPIIHANNVSGFLCAIKTIDNNYQPMIFPESELQFIFTLAVDNDSKTINWMNNSANFIDDGYQITSEYAYSKHLELKHPRKKSITFNKFSGELIVISLINIKYPEFENNVWSEVEQTIYKCRKTKSLID